MPKIVDRKTINEVVCKGGYICKSEISQQIKLFDKDGEELGIVRSDTLDKMYYKEGVLNKISGGWSYYDTYYSRFHKDVFEECRKTTNSQYLL